MKLGVLHIVCLWMTSCDLLLMRNVGRFQMKTKARTHWMKSEKNSLRVLWGENSNLIVFCRWLFSSDRKALDSWSSDHLAVSLCEVKFFFATIKFFDDNIVMSGNFVLNAKNSNNGCNDRHGLKNVTYKPAFPVHYSSQCSKLRVYF